MDSSIEAFLNHTLATISRCGWAVTGVFDADPPFAYTVGLTPANHPELLIVGLDMQTSQGILNNLARQIMAGVRYETGVRIPGLVLEDYEIRLDAVGTELLATARAIYGPDVRALQVLWPDPQNRLPGESGFDPTYAQ